MKGNKSMYRLIHTVIHENNTRHSAVRTTEDCGDIKAKDEVCGKQSGRNTG